MNPNLFETVFIFYYFIINYCFSSELCWDKFDPNYKNQCLAGEWQQRYYFDHASLTCRLFWYDGCQGSSRNMFDDLLSCQWLCEEQPRYSSKSCLQPFDEHYRDECNGGRWKQQYYFDKTKKRCVSFWFDGCKGESENIFQDEITCVKMCESDAKKSEAEEKGDYFKNYYESKTSAEIESYESEFQVDSAKRKQDFSDIKAGIKAASTMKPKKPHKHRHKQKNFPPNSQNEEESKMTTIAIPSPPNPKNICYISNPCENNGTCIFDSSKNQYYCKCFRGYTNDNCTERIDADPCASNPCQNGATCAAKATSAKILYECICLQGYGGINCETKPCDESPCKNNGTCRTTRSLPAFFCECPSEWGGKHCELSVPQTSPLKYGKNVKLVSSGQPEWIEELKKRKIKAKTVPPPPIKTAKDLNRNMIKLNDEPMEGSGYYLSSAEIYKKYANSTELMNLENALKSGHIGGEFSTVHEKTATSFGLTVSLPLYNIYSFCSTVLLLFKFL